MVNPFTFLKKTFLPNAQVAGLRRQRAFGTTSKVPAVLAAGGIAAAGLVPAGTIARAAPFVGRAVARAAPYVPRVFRAIPTGTKVALGIIGGHNVAQAISEHDPRQLIPGAVQLGALAGSPFGFQPAAIGAVGGYAISKVRKYGQQGINVATQNVFPFLGEQYSTHGAPIVAQVPGILKKAPDWVYGEAKEAAAAAKRFAQELPQTFNLSGGFLGPSFNLGTPSINVQGPGIPFELLGLLGGAVGLAGYALGRRKKRKARRKPYKKRKRR